MSSTARPRERDVSVAGGSDTWEGHAKRLHEADIVRAETNDDTDPGCEGGVPRLQQRTPNRRWPVPSPVQLVMLPILRTNVRLL